jgi:hypothetical protein
MSVIHESREDIVSEEEQRAKINTDRKRSSYIEKVRFEKSQNYCSTGERTAELNIHLFILKSLFPQKLSDVNFTSPTSTVGLNC